MHLANLLGLPYFSLLAAPETAPGRRNDLIIFSRYKIIYAKEFRSGFETGALLANLTETPLGNVSIVNVHLHAADEDRRLAEIEEVL